MNIERIAAITAITACTVIGCGGSDTQGSAGAAGSGGGGSGGAPATKEDPSYALAFPQDRVPRLDITIPAESWQAMVDDMTDMLGAFGMGGGLGPGGPGSSSSSSGGGPGSGGSGSGGSPGGMMPPQELIDACAGLKVDDACSATFNGMDIMGTCADLNGQIMCMPAGGPGGVGPGDGGDFLGRNPIYVDCTVATEDRSLKHAGIRFKGNSSLAGAWMSGVWKMPLRLTFDKYEDEHPETKNQRFYGFKSLSLSNGSMDPSLLRDKIGTEVFANAGIPAPATAFYRVFIDHGEGSTYFGLYTAIELPSDDSFLDTHFGSHKGNLYKPEGTGARWATFDKDTLGKENHEDEADYSDAKALYDALHADRSDAGNWRAGLEAHFDVQTQFLHWLALNTVIQDWDTYGNMSHNYYLYANPKADGRFVWIPWDHTFAFNSQMNALSLGLDEVTDQWPLIRYLLDDEAYKELYRAYVAQAAAKEYEPVTAGARFQAAHDLIAPYVTGPEGEKEGYTFLTSPTSFDDGLAALLAHVKARQAAVATFLSQ